MKLLWSPRSPFVRKVMIVLHETGLLAQVTCDRHVVAATEPPNPEVLSVNPLCKIPALILENGSILYDSRVIVEYLDGLHDGPKLIPLDANSGRFGQLTWQALGDGMTDILILWRHERVRELSGNETVIGAFEEKLRACMERLEADASALSQMKFGIGQIAIVCALGQLELRFANSGWESAHPSLAAWWQKTMVRASVDATKIIDDLGGSDPGARPELSISPFRF